MSAKKNLQKDMDLPVIAAPMFLVSTPKMALATCKEGIVGSFPALNKRSAADFEKWLIEMNDGITQLKQDNPNKKIAPYAVNLIVHKTNPRLQEDLELCVKYKVPVIITSLGAVPELVKAVHSYGGIVLHDVTNVYHAKKAAKAGVDGLIAVSAGAGGHAGTMSPMTLVSEIKSFFDGIVVLAGGLSNGSDILTAETMGADFAYMGTRFLATKESEASDEYKQMVCDAQASDIVYTSAVSGVPANFMKQSLENAGFDLDEIKRKGENAPKLKSLDGEAKSWKTVWSAGHGVSKINDIPTIAELANNLKTEYGVAKENLLKKNTTTQPEETIRKVFNRKPKT